MPILAVLRLIPALTNKTIAIMFSNNPNVLCAQLAHVLDAILKKYKYSSEFQKLGVDDHFFDDSCKFVGLHYEVGALVSLLHAQVSIEQYLTDFETPQS